MPPTRGSSALLLLFRLLLIPHTSIVRLLHRLRHYDRVECTNRSRIRVRSDPGPKSNIDSPIRIDRFANPTHVNWMRIGELRGNMSLNLVCESRLPQIQTALVFRRPLSGFLRPGARRSTWQVDWAEAHVCQPNMSRDLGIKCMCCHQVLAWASHLPLCSTRISKSAPRL
ncbi:hypothetical protein KC356_g134 [Hortaea werneckii]|nr:hypothetical protein KC356_g134 [Hortaea werneckii]